jgi:hypothetical protein
MKLVRRDVGRVLLDRLALLGALLARVAGKCDGRHSCDGLEEFLQFLELAVGEAFIG